MTHAVAPAVGELDPIVKRSRKVTRTHGTLGRQRKHTAAACTGA
jgi:hypothetical protein